MRVWRWWIPMLLLQAGAAAAVWQPVTDYSISFPGERSNAAPPINPFENFTHLGTDFGWMGPGQKRIDARAGIVRVRPDGEWTGTWHSLAGLATENFRQFDPTDVLGLGGAPETRAPITAVTLDARGTGEIRVELADVNRNVVWSRQLNLSPGERSRQRFEVDPAKLGRLKFINWVAEPGCGAEVSSIGFEVARPDLPAEEWLFRVSLGKLRRCHDPESGLTRDRAHAPPGVFDSVTSTGMHALASAAAAAEGILDREVVAEEIRRSVGVMLGLPKGAGFLPHFVQRDADGRPMIHPGTEYSTVDTAITLQCLRLAAETLHLEEVSEQVRKMIVELDFDALTDAEGWIGHGLLEDGKTLLPNDWRDWGGETALILAMENMRPDREARGRMDHSGRVFRGCGFIAEIQSLVYPDFDRGEPDLVTGVSWPKARRDLLAQQAAYFPEQWPESPAARAGLFGLSAGEAGMPGAGYSANGVETAGVRWLHPHEMVLSLALTGGERYPEGIARLERSGFLFPQGLPENIEIGLSLHNPMQGSLNAAFEALASYHGWRRGKGNDILDRACMEDPLMRLGAARFYR